jgi:hypothetical protein
VPNVGGVRVEIDAGEYDRIVSSPAGPTARYLYQLTARIVQRAKLLAPVGAPSRTPQGHPSGWLRSHIWWESGQDRRGAYTLVGDDAVTSSAAPFPGEPYPEHIEFPRTRKRRPPPFARDDRPFVVPAVEAIFREEGGTG